MDQVAGALLQTLGAALSFLYELIPVYGVAIFLLTIAVRLLLLPLTIKQTRSMQAMGRLQPKVKELQRRHKGDRQKLNEEMMKLYREHGANPLGGCLPLLLQLPVFFALYAVLRAAIPEIAVPAEPVTFGTVEDAFCRPVGEPSISGTAPNQLECDTDGDGSFELSIPVAEWRERDGEPLQPRDVLTRCSPQREGGETEFLCNTPVGTGHLPADSELFEAIIEDGEPFLGMYLSCSATQAQSEEAFRECAPRGAEGSTLTLVGYYGLIALMVLSTFYQTRQMQAVSGSQQPGAQTIGRIMPVFLGFISLSIPAGVLVYWVTTNVWQIGQQYVMIKQREAGEQQAAAPKPAAKGDQQEEPKPKPKPQPGPTGGRRDGRSRKRRRKR